MSPRTFLISICCSAKQHSLAGAHNIKLARNSSETHHELLHLAHEPLNWPQVTAPTFCASSCPQWPRLWSSHTELSTPGWLTWATLPRLLLLPSSQGLVTNSSSSFKTQLLNLDFHEAFPDHYLLIIDNWFAPPSMHDTGGTSTSGLSSCTLIFPIGWNAPWGKELCFIPFLIPACTS